MIERVPAGQSRVFQRTVADPGEQRFFRVWQNWDYRPGRLDWRNKPSLGGLPRTRSRIFAGRSVTALPPLDVVFKGPSKDVVDFYGTGTDAYFVSDALFRLIDEFDPESLEHVPFAVYARDSELAFHVVMPRRVLEAIDTRRTTVAITDEDYAGTYFRFVRFPEGMVFTDEPLERVGSFSDLDVGGWYWSVDLLGLAKAHGVRGLFAKSVASVPPREVMRL